MRSIDYLLRGEFIDFKLALTSHIVNSEMSLIVSTQKCYSQHQLNNSPHSFNSAIPPTENIINDFLDKKIQINLNLLIFIFTYQHWSVSIMAMRDSYNYYPQDEQPRRPNPPPPGTQGDDWGGPPPPPPPGPSPAPAPAPKIPRTGPIIGLRPGGMIVLMGVLIFFVGAILLQSATLLEAPEYEDFENGDDWEKIQKDYDDAMEGYTDTLRTLLGVGRILNWVGCMFIVLPLYVMGITSDNQDWKVRASMLSTATAIVVAVIIVTMFSGFPFTG
jgi:hypothetical protein